MTYDISDIKKLSTKEKLRIIDELWETIDADEVNTDQTFDEYPEIVAMLQERMEKYERGEGKSLSWEETKRILLNNIDKRQNAK